MEGATDSTRVLVTGASGFIAAHVIKQLQEGGYQVRGTLRSLEDKVKVEKLQNLVPEAAFKLELVEADLTKPESWEPAVKDMTYVIHVASPFPVTPPKDESEVITPAVQGTQAILKACVQAKSVKKVVLTSSSVAVCFGQTEHNKVYTEDDWMDTAKLDPYGKSKVMAEKAAWDYVKELPDEDKIELAVMNPGYVVGPVLLGTPCPSMEIPKRLLERHLTFIPKINFPIIDVRDVASAHIKAMTLQDASGKRHILVADNMWMKEFAVVLSKEFKPQGYNVPTTNCPNAMLNFIGMFNKSVKAIIPQCNSVIKFENARMKDVLGITPRDVKETIIDMAYSLIEAGLVKKSKKYKSSGGNVVEEDIDEEKKSVEENGEKKEIEKVDEKATENGDIQDVDKSNEELKKDENALPEDKNVEEKDNKEAEKEVNINEENTNNDATSKTEENKDEQKEGE